MIHILGSQSLQQHLSIDASFVQYIYAGKKIPDCVAITRFQLGVKASRNNNARPLEEKPGRIHVKSTMYN
jgi:hypothetical protein